MRRIITLLGFLAAFTAANVGAQTKTCSLLTAKDLAIVGATGQGFESSMQFPDGTPKGGTMMLCQWSMPPGGLMMSTAKMPPGTSREAVMTMLNQSWGAAKAKGWKEEKQEFGGVSCFLMTPPAGDKRAPKPTGCTIFIKGSVLSIVSMGTTRVEMEKVRALVDSAAGRL